METAHDLEGIRTAARELLAEAMMAQHRERIERQMAGAANLESALRATEVPRTMAAGYYAWVTHLFFIERSVSDIEVQAVEARGLAIVASARREFDRDHPPCPRCGMRMIDLRSMCGNCAYDPNARAA